MAIVPLSTIGTRYGNSVSTVWMPPKPTTKLGLNWRATAENQREKPIRNFSIDPASSIRTSIADPVFADPVFRDPYLRQCEHCRAKNGEEEPQEDTRHIVVMNNDVLKCGEGEEEAGALLAIC